MSELLTAAAYFVGVVVVYYAALFCISLARTGPDGDDPGVAFVIFVAALNEEAVIGATIESLLSLDHDRYVICIGDDGSTDRTAEILDRYASEERLVVVHRTPPRVQLGKSDVLNDCFKMTMRMLASDHPVLGGADLATVVVGIVDADGRLDNDTLRAVAPYFSDQSVASVQIGVRIGNADANLLTRLQDMEFVGFSAFVQRARDRLGSSGLGGNGQFTRLSALACLEEARGRPWELHALTEDLELGLALICRGWRTRYCPTVFVAQQGLPGWRSLFRQRTRWIQGHYSCWSYLPKLARAPTSLMTRVDLSLYLLLIITVVIVTFSTVASALAIVGLVDAHNAFLSFMPVGRWRNVMSLLFGITPITLFMYVYQRYALQRFQIWEIPAAALVFTAYTYVWILATVRALLRTAAKRRNWVKTPRTPELAGEPATTSAPER